MLSTPDAYSEDIRSGNRRGEPATTYSSPPQSVSPTNSFSPSCHYYRGGEQEAQATSPGRNPWLWSPISPLDGSSLGREHQTPIFGSFQGIDNDIGTNEEAAFTWKDTMKRLGGRESPPWMISNETPVENEQQQVGSAATTTPYMAVEYPQNSPGPPSRSCVGRRKHKRQQGRKRKRPSSHNSRSVARERNDRGYEENEDDDDVFDREANNLVSPEWSPPDIVRCARDQCSYLLCGQTQSSSGSALNYSDLTVTPLRWFHLQDECPASVTCTPDENGNTRTTSMNVVCSSSSSATTWSHQRQRQHGQEEDTEEGEVNNYDVEQRERQQPNDHLDHHFINRCVNRRLCFEDFD